jgi:hypothetical protein
MAKGEDKCPLKDDRGAIEKKLLAADGVIFSAPVCVDNVSRLSALRSSCWKILSPLRLPVPRFAGHRFSRWWMDGSIFCGLIQ